MKISKTSLAERMIALLLAAVVVVSAIPIGALRVSAATLVQLSGSVTDQVTGSGIADVTVTLTSETSDAVVEGTQTDANGAYAVNLTAGAAYTVSFSKEGYKGNQIAYTGADTTADTSGVDVQMEEKKEDTTFAFAMPAPDAVPYGTDFSNIAVSQEQPDVAVTYKSLDENVATVDADGKVTALCAGTVTITAALEESEEYKKAVASYDLTIEKADQTGFVFANPNPGKQGWGTGSFENAASGGEGTGAIHYAVTEGNECGSVDPDSGVLTFIKEGTIKVTAEKEEDSCYKAAVASYQITVEKGDQTGFQFKNSAPSVSYGENGNFYTNELLGTVADATITYAITEQKDADGNNVSDVAEIDAQLGTLTIKRPGTVKVVAESTGSAGYNDAQAEYVLTIHKANPQVGFADGSDVSILYGEKGKRYINALTGAEALQQNAGSIVYEVTGQTAGSEIVEQLDSSSGEITFKDGVTGRATVNATWEESDCYTGGSASYTVTVSYAQTPADAYEVTGDKANNSEWYTGNVKIAAPTGYQISYSNTLEDNEWKTAVDWDTEWDKNGTNPGREIYLRDLNSGAITDAVSVDAVKLDKTDPVVYDITYSKTAVDKVLEGITFGLYNAEYIDVTISAYDAISGVASLSYAYMSDGTVANGVSQGETTVDVTAGTPGIEIDTQTGKVSYSFRIPAEFRGKIQAAAVDGAGRRAQITTEKTIVVDNEAPVVGITLHGTDGNAPVAANYQGVYQQTIVAEVTVEESNFMPDATHAIANGEEKMFDSSWSRVNGTDTWKNTITFSEDAVYSLKVSSKDLLDKETSEEVTFTVDQHAPATGDIQIEYSPTASTWEKVLHMVTFGYYAYKDNVTVTLHAQDRVSGVESFAWTYTQEENTSTTKNVALKNGVITQDQIAYSNNGKNAKVSFVLTATEAEQFRGSVAVTVTDKAGNTSDVKNDGTRINIVDNISPIRTVTYSPAYRVVDAATYEEIENYNYESENTNAILYYDGDITATFAVTEANFYPEDVKIFVNGTRQESQGWTQNGDRCTSSLTLTEDGIYTITMEYDDRSGNVMDSYTSQQMIIDTERPEVKIDFLDAEGRKAECPLYENYFNQDITAKVTVTDPNFVADEAELVLNNETLSGDSWKKDGVGRWVYTMPLTTEQYYDMQVKATDFMGREGTGAASWCIDKTAPGAERMTITYNDALNAWERVLNTVTFGYYAYHRDIDVTVTAWDDMSGIDSFVWTYSKETDASGVNVTEKNAVIGSDQITYSEDGKQAKATFCLSASEYEQYRGSIAVKANDRAGNSSVKNDNARIEIIDTISPTRSVSYTAAKQVVDADTLQTKTEYQYDAENTNAILYYDDDVTARFDINEANFYPEDVAVCVNGQRQNNVTWSGQGDRWTGTLTISGDGEYIVTMSYTDRSGNRMTDYRSEKIVIDTVAPVIQVNYQNQNVANVIDGVKYYNAAQTATISITDQNFRADDVTATVSAVDAEDNPIVVSDYASYLSNRDNWQKNGDVYTANITYSIDANYQFDIAYKDLALHDAADYVPDKFTVDKTPPANVAVTYSESVLEEVLEAVTFGFYNAQATITITAQDETTGIHQIVFDAPKGNDVSNVNSEIAGMVITEDQIGHSGKNASVAIRVPQGELGEQNQFNGTVACKVADRAGNTSNLSDDRRTVVDNIKPVINVTMDDPVKEENEIAYYDGDVTVTMEITEANFYAENVELRVTRDDAQISVTPQWSDESKDVHIGTFTLEGDGDYMITADYTDKSGNEMEQYASQQITIDTEDPVISVSDIVAGSASKEEKYGFTITAEDQNLDGGTFETSLTAVEQNENGSFETKEIPLGTARAVEAGRIYTYTVENLPDDAIYTLSCSVTDMAGHTTQKFSLADGSEYENVQFSINRHGSNFLLDADTEELTAQYYVYSVEKDVIIREINVDVVEDYTVRLNDEVLGENRDYKTELSGDDGQWSERDYIIDKQLFQEEGEYYLTVESKDKTETVAYSDVKNAGVAFVVDQSAPIVTITGLKQQGRYQTDEKTVSVMPTDEGGKLNSFAAIVLDSDGNPIKNAAGEDISRRVELTGEDLLTQLADNDGKITFTVPEGLDMQVQIICTDCAVQPDGSTNEYNELFQEITVSPSQWIMFYANKTLFYGAVAAVCVPVAGGTAWILLRRKRKILKK